MRSSSDRRGSLQLVLDGALALGLFAALAAVFLLDRGAKPAAAPADAPKLQVVEAPQPKSAPARKLRLGVSPAGQAFDDMGRLLDSLGEGYRYQKFPLEDLLDKNKMAEFDVIFLTCSGVPVAWLGKLIGKGERPGTEVYEANDEALKPVYESLRQFVGRGGTLYASDLHYKLVAPAFTDYSRPNDAAVGKVQNVNAQVVDPGLRELIGGEMPLRFDMEGWYPAAFAGEKLTTYLRGTYQPQMGEARQAAFLVKFPYRDGTVIFTSFHNEKQNSETELKLLRYLVFSAVTAEVETRVRQTLVRGGFSPAKQNLFSASAGEPSATTTYHAEKAGHLQFALGFQNLGARLKLTVKSPGGKTVEQEGDSTFTIDVPAAEAGDWQYTVTAVKLPNENFPFTVTVGQK
ncbi:MAG TPA: hypothetical protein VGN42_22160 [Pirellulales bacterium]|nr:hypothetical protein [Pirellulales bacterium]